MARGVLFARVRACACAPPLIRQGYVCISVCYRGIDTLNCTYIMLLLCLHHGLGAWTHEGGISPLFFNNLVSVLCWFNPTRGTMMDVYVINSGDGDYAVFADFDKAKFYVEDLWHGIVTQADDDGIPIPGLYWITYPNDPDAIGDISHHIVIE